MNYELKDTNWIDAPKVKVLERDPLGNIISVDPTKVEVYVNVTTGIVGDTYGFIKVNTVLMEFPMSMTGLDMQADTQIQATNYIVATYPNT